MLGKPHPGREHSAIQLRARTAFLMIRIHGSLIEHAKLNTLS